MSTIRVYQNNNRVATAVPLKNGTVLQVYPTKKTFATEADFKSNWLTWGLMSIDFKKTDPVPKRTNNSTVRQPARKSTERWTYKNQFSFTAPAGTYYIGDICYALPNSVYDKIFGDMGGYSSGLYSKGNDFFIVDGTAYGDGCYRGSDGKNFPVDAGIIGMASTRICDMRSPSIGCGHIYTFDKPVTCRFGGGVFTFIENGSIRLRINTAGDDEDDCDGDCDC